MAITDDEVFGAPPKKKTLHEIGQPLDTLSVGELTERVEFLQAEITRIKAMRASTEASKKAADAIFNST